MGLHGIFLCSAWCFTVQMWSKMLASGKMYFTVCKKCFQNGSHCTTQYKINWYQGSTKGDWSAWEKRRTPMEIKKSRGTRSFLLPIEVTLIFALRFKAAYWGTHKRSNWRAVHNFSNSFSPPVYHLGSAEVFRCSGQHLVRWVALQFHACKHASSLRPTVHFILFPRQFQR